VEVAVDNRGIVERYLSAYAVRDLAAARELQHPDIVARYPQSGETFRGRDNYMSMQESYPGLPEAKASAVTGESNTIVLPSSLPFGKPTVTVFGGDQFVVEGVATYPNGEVFNVVMILRLQGGKVIEETTYFAAPFEAPEWRRPYVE
jgi:ketosteroid isomerase-like protein